MIYNHLMVLMQAEVECFHAGTSLLQDYHDTQFQAGGSRDSIALVRGPNRDMITVLVTKWDVF